MLSNIMTLVIFIELQNFLFSEFMFISSYQLFRAILLMAIKSWFGLITLLCLFSCAFTQCAFKCTSCSNSTSCSACDAGFFLINNTFCAPCPIGCSACSFGANGRPTCTACVAPAQLEPTIGLCFLCDPSCLTCTGNPRNCASCTPGKQLRIVNSSGVCGIIDGCPIQNCLSCSTPDSTGFINCAQCLPGYFTFRQVCYPCKFPCSICSLDASQAWTNVIAPFWLQLINTIFAATGGATPPPGTLPPFMNNLDFAGMPVDMQRGWTQAYLLTKMILNVKPMTQFLMSLPTFMQFYVRIQTQSFQQQQASILQKINQILNKNYTLPQLYNQMGLSAASLTVCAGCAEGFDIAIVSGVPKCQKCMVGCKSCSSGACSSCIQGFYLSGTTTCAPCDTSCATCQTSPTNCLKCVPPKSLVAGTCILCQQPCATCSSSNTSSCLTCKRPYSINANSGSCYRCQQDLCVNCQSTNTSICLLCKEGSILVDGQCQFCPANCSSCSSGTTPSCFQCLQGYKLVTQSGISRCIACSRGCLSCQFGPCLACQPGTYLNPSNGTCLKCRSGCKVCSSFQVCTVFQNGVVIFGDKFIGCRPGCKTCDATAPDVCLQCEPRYFISSGICRQCQPGCLQCSSQTVCTKCIENLHLSSDNCLQCAGNCRTCNSASLSTCLTCKRGYTLVGTECLHQCQRGCLQCDSADSNICLVCAQGYSLKLNGTCVKCLGSCSGSCDPKNINVCLSCVNGFQLKNNACQRCPKGCTTCLNGECSACAPGYTLTQNAAGSLVCKQKCKSPCYSCQNNVCLGCQEGYSLQNGRCLPNLSCNPNCNFCPAGTQKISGVCVPCPTANCATCSSGACVNCLAGFYLNSGSCTACPTKCSTCYSSTKCNQCAAGYVKEIISMGTGIQDAVFGDQCIQCNQNCKTCVVEPDRCTSCPQGSRLFSFRCAGIFTVGYQYQININYNQFLQNSQSQSFLIALSNILGINPIDNYITSIRSGSTVLSGTISTSGQSQAINIQQNLNSNGNSVSGYAILSSSSSVYYGDTVYNQPEQVKEEIKKVNVGLIVGVVVGSVVLLGLIGIAIWKIKFSKTMVREAPSENQLNAINNLDMKQAK